MGGFERYAKRVLIHPLYPWAVRWFLIGFLVTLTYSAFFGPNDPRLNFAMASVGVAIALFIVVSRLYAHLTKQPLHKEMCRFGFAFLPLALMGHNSHNLGHLFTGYRLALGAIASLVGQTPSVSAVGFEI